MHARSGVRSADACGHRRPRPRARVPPRLRRQRLRRSVGVRARGRGRSGEDDAVASCGRRAEESGARVLQALPAESETRSVVLRDRGSPRPGSTKRWPSCPPDSGVRFSRADARGRRGPAPDAHAIGVAVLNALRALAEEGSARRRGGRRSVARFRFGGSARLRRRSGCATSASGCCSTSSRARKPLCSTEFERSLPADRLTNCSK